MKIEYINIDLVQPYWKNPRKNEGALRAVKESIEKYGFNVPIILDRENIIVAGHTRWRAAKDLKMPEIPCIYTDLPPNKLKEYRIVDNRTSELSEWDLELLVQELREITDIDGFLNIYFADGSLDDLMREPEGKEFEKDITPDKIQKVQDKVDKGFNQVVEDSYDDQVEVTCPHCAETFFVSAEQIKTEQRVQFENKYKKG